MTDARPARRLAVTGTVTAALTALAVFGVFFVAPEDADQGIIQKIFYFHVAIAITSLLAFGVACIDGILYLRSRDERHDEVSSISRRDRPGLRRARGDHRARSGRRPRGAPGGSGATRAW